MGIAALAYAYVVLVRRCWWEKCLLLVAVVPIALISNAARIVVTAYIYRHVSEEAGKKFSPRCGGLGHDRAGRRAVWTVALVLEVADSRLHGRRRRRFDSPRGGRVVCRPQTRIDRTVTTMAKPANQMPAVPGLPAAIPPAARPGNIVPVPPTRVSVVGGAAKGPAVRGSEKGGGLFFALNVLRRWWLIAMPVGLVLAAEPDRRPFGCSSSLQYEAAAWLKIDEKAPFLAYETKSEESRSKEFFQTQIEMIRSPLVLGPVVERPEIAQLADLQRKPDTIAWLAKQVKVSPVGESELFRIHLLQRRRGGGGGNYQRDHRIVLQAPRFFRGRADAKGRRSPGKRESQSAEGSYPHAAGSRANCASS